MRQQIKAFVRRHPDVFNPIWPLVYPMIRGGGGEIASSYDDNLTAFTNIYLDNLWEIPSPAAVGAVPSQIPLCCEGILVGS